MENKIVVHGVYRHFKGGMYIVEDIGRDSETEELLWLFDIMGVGLYKEDLRKEIFLNYG